MDELAMQEGGSQETTAPEVKVETTPSIEDRAKEQGWRPKEEYEGDPGKWVSAETFVAKGELIEKIEALGKELKNTKKAMGMLQEHHTKVKEAEFARAIEYLKAKKKAAYEAGDVDAIMEFDDKIAEVKETQKAQVVASNISEEAAEAVHPDFVQWQKRNSWYTEDEEMKEVADDLGIAYANRTKKSPSEVLSYVESRIRKMYPEKFTNPNKGKPSVVEGSGSPGRTTPKGEEGLDLSDEERQVMNTFIRSGVMTKEEYLKELKLVRNK